MSDLIKRILELTSEGKTINEIAATLNLTNKQLFNIFNTIKSKGLEFKKTYYSNGEIKYNLIKKILDNNDKTLITSPNERHIKMLLKSDCHIGSVYERIDLISKCYDYCVKNNIHVILDCGDFIDGIVGGNKKIHDNAMDQIDYFLKKYPFDKDIITFGILGNHDLNTLLYDGINFENIIESYRHDIVSLGYEKGSLNIKNDKIFLSHPIANFEPVNIEDNYIGKKLILEGHSHHSSIVDIEQHLKVKVPSLVTFETKDYPSFMTITLNFEQYGYIGSINLEHFIFINDNIIKVNDIFVNLINQKIIIPIKAKNEEELPKKLVLDKNKHLSQIEKFNNKYNKA